MFSILKSRNNRISKRFKNQIKKSHLKFISKKVPVCRLAAYEKQHRDVFFYPIKNMTILSLVEKTSTIYLCNTFLYSDAKCEKSTFTPDFQVYKYKMCAENFVKSYINMYVDSYEYDQDCNVVLFYKIFDNFELRILCHILITYFNNLVKNTSLSIHDNCHQLNIVHTIAPDFQPINLSDCFSRLFTYLEMQQQTQVDKLPIIQSLTISVTERQEIGHGLCKFPHNIEISFKVSLNNLLPVVEKDILEYEKMFFDIIRKKLVHN